MVAGAVSSLAPAAGVAARPASAVAGAAGAVARESSPIARAASVPVARPAPLARAAAALLACACGSKARHAPPVFPGLTIASSASPLDPACAQTGSAPGSAVEPQVAIDPLDPRHLIGVWQQDRYANGGANGLATGLSFDGGATWTRTAARFSLCSGGSYERASDPWVTFAPDGTAHQIGFAFNKSNAGQAMLASRSLDGGRTWTAPIALQAETDPDFALDKETITADAHGVYAVWDRLTGQTNPTSPSNTGPTWFSRSLDNGATWAPARAIYDPGLDAQTIGNQIVVLPDGTLVNVLSVITSNSSQSPQTAIAVLRSTDHGATWGAPVQVAQALFAGVFDLKSMKAVRSGDVVPAIAVDAASGALYALWEDARFSRGARDGIAISRSDDGGLHWSAPAQVNGAGGAQAFTPAVSVSRSGKLGVTYYDLRNDDPGDRDHLLATAWLATSSDGGRTFVEEALAAPFDLRTAPFALGYFVGDYQGLVHAGEAFLPFFTMTNAGDGGRAEVFFRPAPAAAPAFAPAPLAGGASVAGLPESSGESFDARGALRSVARTAY